MTTLDNALMESAIGLYKAELINRRGPWRALAHVETATAGYLHWFNTQRIHSAIGDIPPAGHEAAWYAAAAGNGKSEKNDKEGTRVNSCSITSTSENYKIILWLASR